jgi:hypothetical protein
MLRPEKQDKAFHLSLFNHILSCTMVCLFQFFDVLTYGNSPLCLCICAAACARVLRAFFEIAARRYKSSSASA